MFDLYDWQPLYTTFKLATVTTLVLLAIGIPLAYWIASTRFKLKYAVEALVSLPLVLPPTVLGFYLLVFFSPYHSLGGLLKEYFNLQLPFTFPGLVVASVIFSLPFMVQPIQSGLENLPRSLSEASYSLGKSRWTTLVKVLLPNIKPSLLAGMVLTFAHTVGEFGVVLMIGGSIPGETKVASIAIFQEVETLNFAAAHFHAATLLTLSFLVLFILYYFNKRSLKPF